MGGVKGGVEVWGGVKGGVNISCPVISGGAMGGVKGGVKGGVEVWGRGQGWG